MSTIRYNDNDLAISTYAGAEGCNPNTGGRTCVQITNNRLGLLSYASLTMDQWVDLVCFIRRMDHDGIGITSVPETIDV